MTRKIKIDKSIVLPAKCDNMPHDLKQHLLAALTDARKKLDCDYKDLHWQVKIDKKTNTPYISVRKAA